MRTKNDTAVRIQTLRNLEKNLRRIEIQRGSNVVIRTDFTATGEVAAETGLLHRNEDGSWSVIAEVNAGNHHRFGFVISDVVNTEYEFHAEENRMILVIEF